MGAVMRQSQAASEFTRSVPEVISTSFGGRKPSTLLPATTPSPAAAFSGMNKCSGAVVYMLAEGLYNR